MSRKALIAIPAGVLCLGLAGWAGLELYKRQPDKEKVAVPTTIVKRGDVRITVPARGDLQGGNPEMLTAPMTGGRDMAITFLRRPGELVETGDVVVTFDPTEQEFALREAEADLAEVEQQLIQAKSDSEAKEEESRYALAQASKDVKLAELETRKNPLVEAIKAQQNTLALAAARDRLRQLEQDVGNQKATNQAAIAIQEAGRNKAKMKADMARRTIDSLTLRAKSKGYVSVQQNQNSNFLSWGMQLPIFQVGDTVRAGMAVAQIPDMKDWEVATQIGELDRGHLANGQPAEVTVVALPDRRFAGHVKNIGGTGGAPWDRRFECKVALENPAPELRLGMSARIVITTEVLTNVLWVPSQALFESDGRTFVYVLGKSGFLPVDVKLVRRSESQAVITGLSQRQTVALASPIQPSEKKGAGGALRALPKS